MEHNSPNRKTAFDFLSTLVLKNQSKRRASKNEQEGEVYNTPPNVRSKSNN